MASKFFIQVECVTDFATPDGIRRFLGVAAVEAIPHDLPLDANLREPNRNNNVLRGIVDTLINDPAKFVSRNLGLRISAEDAVYEYDHLGNVRGLWLIFLQRNQGVLNGGHTLKAISIAKKQGVDLSAASLPFLIEVGLPQEQIPDTCVSLNSSSKVDRRSMLNKSGAYNELKMLLEADGYTNVAYYQNQSDVSSDDRRCHISHVVSLLTCLNNNRYNYGDGVHPIVTIKGGGGSQETLIATATPLYSNLFDGAFKIEKQLHELIRTYSFHSGFHRLPGVREATTAKKHAHLLDGTSFPLIIPSTIALPVVAAFRPFIDDNRWVMPFNTFGKELTQHLWNTYRELLIKEYRHGARSLNPLLSQKGIWEVLCRSSLQFYTQMLKMKKTA